ncbi:putative histone-lysine N-methyltransferase set-23 [Dirofilaria immitis]|nr:putative histone-lysine N-methyltransferase set-23 [Dirofilaria immitis]
MEYTHIESLECGPGGSSMNFETEYEGCCCTGPCIASTGCTCLLYKQDVFKNQNFVKNVDSTFPVLECSVGCSCSFFLNNCRNRCVQFGTSLPLEVFDAGEKGYGLQCREQIKKLNLDHTEVTYIDPSVRGNQSRFINHSCNPNLVMILVRCGTPQVHVGLFALRDIPAYEELTYDYGANTSEFSVKKCLCGSVHCRLFLPACVP